MIFIQGETIQCIPNMNAIIQMQLHETFRPTVDNSMKDSGQVIYPSNLKYTYNSRLSLCRIRCQLFVQDLNFLSRIQSVLMVKNYVLVKTRIVCLKWDSGPFVILYAHLGACTAYCTVVSNAFVSTCNFKFHQFELVN